MQVGISHIIGALFAIVLLVGGAFTVGAKWKGASEANVATVASSETEDTEATPTPDTEPVVSSELPLYPVIRVVDGDTIVVSIDGKNESVRMIGIDTPEINDSRTGVQCFGKEASAYMKSLLEGKKVRLEKDESQGERDRYKRLLAYVFREDGIFVNKAVVANGYGHEYTYDGEYKYQTLLKEAEESARENENGLWAPDACPVKTSVKAKSTTSSAKQTASAAAAPSVTPMLSQSDPVPPPVQKSETEVAAKTPALTPLPMPEPEPAPAPPNTGSYVCSTNTYNCTDFKTQAEAQTVYDACGGVANDIHKLDKNKDGTACDSLR